jgi:hypothetical protein
MPDYSFERCDGHHEMVDFKVRKTRRREAPARPGLSFVFRRLEVFAQTFAPD